VMCLHLMSLLRARAEAKSLSRSGNRTLIQASDNNPLKFMPTPEEALKVMLVPKSAGYLDAKQAVENTFTDLKLHQVALLGAVQAAASELLNDLSPDAISKAAEGKRSLIPGNKSKSWDAYVEAWSRKAGTREHGMLGAFLDLFAEHYDKLSRK
jgi:type VI secretion system protein ImpI